MEGETHDVNRLVGDVGRAGQTLLATYANDDRIDNDAVLAYSNAVLRFPCVHKNQVTEEQREGYLGAILEMAGDAIKIYRTAALELDMIREDTPDAKGGYTVEKNLCVLAAASNALSIASGQMQLLHQTTDNAKMRPVMDEIERLDKEHPEGRLIHALITLRTLRRMMEQDTVTRDKFLELPQKPEATPTAPQPKARITARG